jgi:hypothetical protein
MRPIKASWLEEAETITRWLKGLWFHRQDFHLLIVQDWPWGANTIITWKTKHLYSTEVLSYSDNKSFVKTTGTFSGLHLHESVTWWTGCKCMLALQSGARLCSSDWPQATLLVKCNVIWQCHKHLALQTCKVWRAILIAIKERDFVQHLY